MDTETTLILARIATALEYFVAKDVRHEQSLQPATLTQARFDAVLKEIAPLPLRPVIDELVEANK